MFYRKAVLDDLDGVMEVIEDGRENLRLQGNGQWQFGYPNRDDLKEDINKGVLFVIEENKVIVAVCALTYFEDAYEHLYEGSWIKSEPYMVMHRVAVKKEYYGKGYGQKLFDLFLNEAHKQEIYDLRIDTHAKNNCLIHLILKNHFKAIGKAILPPNKDRVMFERVLIQDPKDYIIFDMDGTLIDSMPYWYLSAYKEMSKFVDIEFKENTNEMKHIVWEYYHLLNEEEAHQFWVNWYNNMNEYFKEVKPKDGIEEFLKRCKEEGKHLCICTGTPLEMAEEEMKRLDFYKYFDFMMSSRGSGHRKEEGVIFDEAITKWNIHHNEVSIYEDLFANLPVPHSKGCRVVGIYDQSSDEGEKEFKEICERYIHSFKELM